MKQLTCLITGATSGIGKAAALGLAKHGHHSQRDGAGRGSDEFRPQQRHASIDSGPEILYH